MHRILTMAGRIVYALALIGFGVYHFMYGAALATLVPSIFPQALYLVYLVGIVFFWAAVTLLMNRGMHYSLSALSGLLLLFIVSIHIPNLSNGGLPFLLKDSALLGATLFMLGASYQASRGEKQEAPGEIR